MRYIWEGMKGDFQRDHHLWYIIWLNLFYYICCILWWGSHHFRTTKPSPATLKLILFRNSLNIVVEKLNPNSGITLKHDIFVSGLFVEADSLPYQPHLSCFPGKMVLSSVITMPVDVLTTLTIITKHLLSVVSHERVAYFLSHAYSTSPQVNVLPVNYELSFLGTYQCTICAVYRVVVVTVVVVVFVAPLLHYVCV